MEPITTYADANRWEKAWQQEYRYGVVLIYPPQPHRAKLTAVRDRYAWSQSSICDAHISLSVPIPRPVTREDLDEIQRRLSGIRPVTLRYGPVEEQPAHRGVVLLVEPQEELKKLLEAVESAPLFEGVPARKYPYRAHMTLAEMVTWEQTWQIIDEVKELPLSGEFTLSCLSYAVPDGEFRFSERARISLGC